MEAILNHFTSNYKSDRAVFMQGKEHSQAVKSQNIPCVTEVVRIFFIIFTGVTLINEIIHVSSVHIYGI